jgi:glucosamine--fructose-6-phosphate aminotransferase (isomerizing)
MNRNEDRYTSSSLIREMLETPGIIRDFDVDGARGFAPRTERVLLTGEGSSRIFPAGLARVTAIRGTGGIIPLVEGAAEAQEYPVAGYHVYAASNSGRTAEVVALLQRLRDSKVEFTATAVVAKEGSPIAGLSDDAFVLSCGNEEATAATKSVVEQALFYQAALGDAAGGQSASRLSAQLPEVADRFAEVQEMEVAPEIVSTLVSARSLYFAGPNDGVGEELALKANEIARRPSDFLSGTYAVHGIEEVMHPQDVVVWIDPPEQWEETFRRTLVEGVGLEIVAISSRETSFPTIQIPRIEGIHSPFLALAAGWNLLVELGLALDIDIDHPERARKVGNEYTGAQ